METKRMILVIKIDKNGAATIRHVWQGEDGSMKYGATTQATPAERAQAANIARSVAGRLKNA